MKKEFLPGCAFILLMSISCSMGMAHLRETFSALETPASEDLLSGKWAPQFEKSFRAALPVSAVSRDLWGRTEYAVFRQGRKGVVVGTGGWLFTEEEFSCPPDGEKNLSDNLTFVQDMHESFAEKGIRLAIVLIPAKARVLQEHLGNNSPPLCREGLYVAAHSFLLKNEVAVTDLLPVMQSSSMHNDLYLKTDTHWSPAGAKVSAQAASILVRTAFADVELPANSFSTQSGSLKDHTGDLASYVPGVPLVPDRILSYVSGVSLASAGAAQNLFDDTAPSVVLVGTSYSANPDWNFEGFLKESLKADVLNMADQGLGPFVVMDKYMQSSALKDNPPRLVVWEIPERYLLMPHDLAAIGKTGL